MTDPALSLGSPQWLAPAIVLGITALAAVAWSYQRGQANRRERAASMALKLTAFGLLALALVNPQWSQERAIPGANLLVVAVDNSRSLQFQQAPGGITRGAAVQQAFEKRGGAVASLDENFVVKRFQFDERPRAVDHFADLSFDGRRSQIWRSVQTMLDRLRRQPVAGVLLATDGNSTEGAAADDLASANIDWSAIPPIYPIVAASKSPLADLRIESATVSQTNFESAPVTIDVRMRANGLADDSVIVELVDCAGKSAATQEITLDAPAQNETDRLGTARFQIQPEQRATQFLQIRARSASDLVASEPTRGDATSGDDSTSDDSTSTRAAVSPPISDAEATLLNNDRFVAVNRAAGPYRVLYVAGRPNWEFKFFRRAIEEDREVRLVGLIRIAKQEARFDFQRKDSDRANALFKGFDADEEAEEYFEPVLLRMGADEGELSTGFPQTADELYAYDALILDDVEANFFSHDQMTLVQQFVSRRGGGLLMLGGEESFSEGAYHRTPIGDLLPFYLESDAPRAVPERPYRIALTKEGWLEPWMRLRQTEPEERTRLDGMAPFRSLNEAGRRKPGAVDLAFVECAEGTRRAALVAQQFGRGRVAALLLGDLWRWGLRRERPEDDDLFKAWRQALRWLIADVPRRVELDATPHSNGAPGELELVVRVRTEAFEPLDNGQVTLVVENPDGGKIDLACLPSVAEPGVYTTSLVPQLSGPYLATANVRGEDGTEVGGAQHGWTAQIEAAEFNRIEPNRAWLKQLAELSGGELCELDDLEQLAENLPTKKAPITEVVTSPAWQRGWYFLTAIACLCGEWGLRRWRGLP